MTRHARVVGQKHLHAAFFEVGRCTNRVRCVAIIIAFAHKTVIFCRRHKERFSQLSIGRLAQLAAHIHNSADRRHGASIAENFVEMKCCDLGIVTLEIAEIKMIWIGLIVATESKRVCTSKPNCREASENKPHRLENGLFVVCEREDKFDLKQALSASGHVRSLPLSPCVPPSIIAACLIGSVAMSCSSVSTSESS